MSEVCAIIVGALITAFVGLATLFVIWWQADLLKRQIALTTFMDLDREWNSEAMIETRKEVRGEDESWNTSSLEGVLEFFEKVGMLRSTKALRNKDILGSTLIWYLARYFLFAKEEIQRLRVQVWKDNIYTDIEDLYEEFVDQEVRENGVKRSAWEERCRETEEAFWDGERQG